MMRALYLRLRFSSLLRNPDGAKAFSEVLLTQLTHLAVREAGPVRTRNANLSAEREHLLRYLAENPAAVDHPKGLLGRVLASAVLMVLLSASVVFLYFDALDVWMSAAGLGAGAGMLAAGLLALTFAGGVMYACNGVVVAAFAAHEDPAHQREIVQRGVVWTLLLGALEMIVLLLTLATSDYGTTGAGVLPVRYAGVLAGLLLPILGGVLSVDLGHSLAQYRAASRQRRAELRLTEIAAEIEHHRATWRHTVRLEVLRKWEVLQQAAALAGTATGFDTCEAFMRAAESRYEGELLALTEAAPAEGDGALGLTLPLRASVKQAAGARQADPARLRWSARPAV